MFGRALAWGAAVSGAGCADAGCGIEPSLSAHATKLYAMGSCSAVNGSTLAEAYESRNWLIWSDLVAVLIRRARKLHDVNARDMLAFEADAFYVMDRGYLDYARLYVLHQAGAFFVTRTKRPGAANRCAANHRSPEFAISSKLTT